VPATVVPFDEKIDKLNSHIMTNAPYNSCTYEFIVQKRVTFAQCKRCVSQKYTKQYFCIGTCKRWQWSFPVQFYSACSLTNRPRSSDRKRMQWRPFTYGSSVGKL